MKCELSEIDIIIIRDENGKILESFIPSKIKVFKTKEKNPKTVLEIQ